MTEPENKLKGAKNAGLFSMEAKIRYKSLK